MAFASHLLAGIGLLLLLVAASAAATAPAGDGIRAASNSASVPVSQQRQGLGDGNGRRGLQANTSAGVRVVDAARVLDNQYCVAFTPYPTGFGAGGGPEPPREVVAALMDRMIEDGRHIKCLLTYGTTGAYAFVPGLAQERGLKVIQGVWLDADLSVNEAQTNAAIPLLKQYPDTIVGVFCGSEVRLRRFAGVANDVIPRCINALRAAGVSQPIGHQATWPEWCNEEVPGQLFPRCEKWEPIASQVDFIAVTAYSWWENRVAGRFPCIPPSGSAAFVIDRYRTVQATYPGVPVVLSEFGWPGASTDDAGYADLPAAFKCNATADTPGCPGPGFGSVASNCNKKLVAQQTLWACRDLGNLPCILFSSHNEPWKGFVEGDIGRFWGFCSENAPYNCSLPNL